MSAGVGEAEAGDAGALGWWHGSLMAVKVSRPAAGSWLPVGPEQAPVGGEPTCAEWGQVGQPFPDVEVAGVVERGLGP